jgi:hypothetical protein
VGYCQGGIKINNASFLNVFETKIDALPEIESLVPADPDEKLDDSGSLGGGRIPPKKADTATVKRSPSANREVLNDLTLSCDLIQSCHSAVEDLKTPCRYAHPWFGPLNALQWFYGKTRFLIRSSFPLLPSVPEPSRQPPYFRKTRLDRHWHWH